MKNKYKTYLLLLLVLGIWGILAYRITSAIQPAEIQHTSTSLEIDFHPDNMIKRDTFSVQKTKRDPFLGTLYLPKKKKKIAPKKKVVHAIEWPNIQYNGLIRKQDDLKQQIFVVTIDRQQYLMKIHQRFKGVKLKKGNETQIYVSYQGKQKTISKR